MPQDPDQKTAKTRDFVHLHLHTDYSLLQSTIQLKPLATRLNELGMSACAVTDYGNMYGAVSFFNTLKYADIKPIIGYEAFFRFESRFDRSAAVKAGEKPYYNLVLLAKDLNGYKNLAFLASKAFTEGLHYKPRIDVDLLRDHSEGLIALSGGLNGPIGHFLATGNEEAALANCRTLQEIFGAQDLYLEIHEGRTEQGQ